MKNAAIALGLLMLAPLLLFGCGPQGLLYDVGPASVTVTPNGGKTDASALINYTISKRATIDVKLQAPDGKDLIVRNNVMRAPDSYQMNFNGTVSVGNGGDMQVLPDGNYTMFIKATDEQGHSEQQHVQVNVRNADAVPLKIDKVVVQPPTFSPNRDGYQDDAYFSYALSKKATTQIYVTDKGGGFHLLSPEKVRDPGEQSFDWNGTENGGQVLPDGPYTYHIMASDTSGNVTDATGKITLNGGGTPRLEIESATFTPQSIPLGGTVHVKITVKNIGDTTVRGDPKWGGAPPSGTAYTTDETYAHWRDKNGQPIYFEVPGVWCVGVSWTNAPSPPPFPIRWNLGKDLKPGDEATITGDIVVTQKTAQLYMWASLIQEGVGYVGGQMGQTQIIVSYGN